ncbi:MAG: sigma-70 family RNA polymerase sigma factor [Dechloromonas sp.]|nr:MAG: sigma-70 family RNA polymerase sigma factor [Dechloromonas sp.]
MSTATHPDPLHELYASHHGWLFGWLRRKLGCPEHAADLAQDTFLRILSSRDALLAMCEPRAYLTTTANRLIIDRARRQAIEQAYLAELTAMADTLAGFPSPEDSLIAVQALAQIAGALEGVSPKAGEAFLLHYLDGLRHAEIADRLGVSARMVRKYLVQCLVACTPAEPA